MAEATIKFHSMLEVIPLAKLMYGLVLTEQDLYEYAGPFLRRSGGAIMVDGFLYSAQPDECGYLMIPCDAKRLIAVGMARHVSDELSTASHLLFQKNLEGSEYLVGSPASQQLQEEVTRNLALYEGLRSSWSHPEQPLAYELTGEFQIQVFRPGTRLPFTGKVDIKFEKELADDKDLPFLREAQVDAMAAFCNYCEVQKRFYSKQADHNALQEAKINSGILCDSAKSGDGLNDNDMLEIFNSFMTFHRYTYKPI